ncbi:hypothetical protein EKO04_000953 [Ascochyta lentis]|uniref:Uncharacterized protein n=1 Tax=Ascochyta lentis TaxID=205686 RepID=A0A8H7JCT8_9PLEO|nr:hypothetical protein EKO04_000953 [Ascochyta lentis]
MAEQLKVEIKRNARTRRARIRIQSISRDLEDSLTQDIDAGCDFDAQSDLHTATEYPGGQTLRASETACLAPALTPPDSIGLANSPNSSSACRNQGVTAATHADHAAQQSHSAQKDFEPSLLMSYLDYAFPVLFPFYKPSVLEGGRSWLLTLALQHPAFYHNIIGLAAYFYGAVPVAPGPEHDACVVKAQTELQTQMEKAVQGVRNSLRDVNERGIQNALSDSIHLLGNIVQLVNFEIAFASSENWQIHLTAAANLFNQTLRHHGKGGQGVLLITSLLEKLRCNVPLNCSVWSAEQAAFRFFTAMVIYQDIIASTTLEKAPTLFSLYSNVIADTPMLDTPSLLNLEEFVGCQTWVLVSIAEISCLNEWKKGSTRQGNFDIMVQVRNATIIQERLSDGVARLNDAVRNVPLQAVNSPYRPLETILAKSNINSGSAASKSTEHRLITRIWAHAAHIYLIVMLSGWQPAHLELRNHVAQALELLGSIDNPSWLRTLAWPLCVTGCLAAKEQESAFRDIANASGGLAMFGTLRDALNIMEEVWSQRSQHNADTWDIASCLRILGHSVLLV